MIGRLNHVAIAVKDLAASTALYRDTLGAKVCTLAATGPWGDGGFCRTAEHEGGIA